MTHAGTDIRSNLASTLERLVQAQVASRLGAYAEDLQEKERAIVAALELVLLEYRTWLDQDPDPTGQQPSA